MQTFFGIEKFFSNRIYHWVVNIVDDFVFITHTTTTRRYKLSFCGISIEIFFYAKVRNINSMACVAVLLAKAHVIPQYAMSGLF